MAQRSNTEWLADLKGPNQESAITDLRKILTRGLTYSLSSRISGDLESVVDDFVQDSLLRILDKIDTFRGESKFTTWAQKIAVRVAYTEMRRQRWKDIRQREAMMAIIAGGMPIDEVAKRMGTNRNALYKLIHDARKRMLQRLKERGLTPGEILVAFEGK